VEKRLERIDLYMYRPDFVGLPETVLSDGYSIRHYREGDRETVAEIEVNVGEFATVEQGIEEFDQEFGAHLSEMPARCLILEAEGIGPIGTITAWWGDFRGETIGRITWVAIKEEFQCRALSKPLLAAAMNLLAQHHSSAYLHTLTRNWRGIGLYQSFGFHRIDESEADHRGWAIVDQCLARRG
jgi:ribosomal protein S18 acetylase RimI-like enzyme